jgi:WD40 repeat protein
MVFRTNFLITTSVDGHLKLWKKQDTGIEFVKHYRAHLTPVVAVSASADGQLFASVSEDGSAKVFDVVNFGQTFKVQVFSLLTYNLLSRYDKYDQVGIHSSCMLLGTSARAVSGSFGCVSLLAFFYYHSSVHDIAAQTWRLALSGYMMDVEATPL